MNIHNLKGAYTFFFSPSEFDHFTGTNKHLLRLVKDHLALGGPLVSSLHTKHCTEVGGGGGFPPLSHWQQAENSVVLWHSKYLKSPNLRGA